MDAHKYMVEQYKKEALNKQLSGVSSSLPNGAYSNIFIKKKKVEKAYDRDYGTNFTTMFYRSLTDWLATKNLFKTFITYRPLKTKITGSNAPEFFYKVMDKLKNIKDLFWVIEGDKNPSSNHAHILLDAEDVNKEIIANAMNRSVKEIKYLERVKDVEGALIYCKKYIKDRGYFRAWEYINRDKHETHADNQYYLNNMPHSVHTSTHPNKEKHEMAQRVSEYKYGWGNMKNRFAEKKTKVNFSRKDKAIKVDTELVNNKREEVKNKIKKSL